MKVVIQAHNGQYSFVRLDFLGSNCEVAPEDVFEVDELTVECWSAIDDLNRKTQEQLKKLVNGRHA